MRWKLTFAATVLGVSVFTGDVFAQSGMSDTRGSTGSTGRTNRANSASSMFGSSSGGGGGRGGAGQSGMQNAIGNNGEFQLGSGGQTTGSERFMRGNRQSGNFVGADASEISQIFSNLTAGRAGSDGAGNFGPQQNNRGSDFNNQQGRDTSAIVPHRLVVDFPYQPPQIAQGSASVAARGITIRGLSRVPSQGPVRVELQGRTAILRGVVATAHDRELAETIALLEPGVSQVQNDLTLIESLPATTPSDSATNPSLPAVDTAR